MGLKGNDNSYIKIDKIDKKNKFVFLKHYAHFEDRDNEKLYKEHVDDLLKLLSQEYDVISEIINNLIKEKELTTEELVLEYIENDEDLSLSYEYYINLRDDLYNINLYLLSNTDKLDSFKYINKYFIENSEYCENDKDVNDIIFKAYPRYGETSMFIYELENDNIKSNYSRLKKENVPDAVDYQDFDAE